MNPPFYLNILLQNKEELVAAKVAEKTGNRRLLGKAASFAANKLVSGSLLSPLVLCLTSP